MPAHRIVRIAPLSAAKTTAVIYLVIGLLFVPLGLLATLTGTSRLGPVAVVLIPLAYVVLGFCGGLLGAALYNLASRWAGGVEISFDESSP